jgi:hypothetical protein
MLNTTDLGVSEDILLLKQYLQKEHVNGVKHENQDYTSNNNNNNKKETNEQQTNKTKTPRAKKWSSCRRGRTHKASTHLSNIT